MITLKTLKDATAQEVFDQVANHLLTQNAKSMEKDSYNSLRCKYRSGDRKCAAGCLIGDDEYRIYMEYRRWSDLAGNGVVPDSHTGLISALQRVHDNYEVKSWPSALKHVAYQFRLTMENVR